MSKISLAEQVNRVTNTLTQDIKNNKLDIPSPPDILLNLRRIANDPLANADDFANVIKHDVNITARLIKVSNCALFASRFPVDTIDGAVKRLGQKKVQSLVTGLVIAQQLVKSKTRGLEAFCSKAWQSSNHVAVLSYALAKKKSQIDPEQALLAGMAHNIGVLPLILKLNTIAELKENPKVMHMVADVVVPKLYKQAGQLIMKNWHFPDDICSAVASHNDLTINDETSIELTTIVKVAFYLCRLNTPYDVEAVPEDFNESAIFSQFWPGWASAVYELNELQQDIEQMKSDLSH